MANAGKTTSPPGCTVGSDRRTIIAAMDTVSGFRHVAHSRRNHVTERGVSDGKRESLHDDLLLSSGPPRQDASSPATPRPDVVRWGLDHRASEGGESAWASAGEPIANFPSVRPHVLDFLDAGAGRLRGLGLEPEMVEALIPNDRGTDSSEAGWRPRRRPSAQPRTLLYSFANLEE